MKKLVFSSLMIVCLGSSATAPVLAEEGVALEYGADVVSSYVWRGADCGGFSVQPRVAVGWKGLELGAWASVELFQNDETANIKEFDLDLSYTIGGLSVGVTDYYFCDGKYLSDWSFNSSSLHHLEANLGYDFGAVALSWNTVLTGADHQADGDRIYSSYVEVSAPFKVHDMECSVAVGASPWEDTFTAEGNHKFNVVNCALTLNKSIKNVPLMGQVVYNPQSDATYFVVGVSF
jgi:hypothetical protein